MDQPTDQPLAVGVVERVVGRSATEKKERTDANAKREHESFGFAPMGLKRERIPDAAGAVRRLLFQAKTGLVFVRL